MLGIVLYAGIDLGPEEAQYWEWSRNLDWGYYSKPPGIAWEIWSGCRVFGNTELGVRIGAIVFAFLTSLAVYWLAKASQLKEETAFWSGVVMALTPLGVMGSFITVTDGGMLLFWTIACTIVAAALAQNREPNFWLLGIAVLCGALFKWPMYLLWIIILLFYRTPKIIVGIGVSLLGLLPSIIWNQGHDWVTFRHVISTIIGQHQKELGATYLKQGNLGDFVAAQAGLLSPIFFLFKLA
jgi:4-amino-4-deoxy-L-arabinose transferase-like glycosyltransferase